MAAERPIRLALLGTGLFARDAHIPALNALQGEFEIVAIYTRDPSSSSAAEAARLIPGEVAITDDLDGLLARDDIEAVDIVWPIHRLPEGIERALNAGKHVISEKPAAPSVAVGRHLLDVYAAHPDLVWMVAENWRYEAAYRQAADLIAEGAIGRLLTVDWVAHNDMSPQNRYYGTPWRRDNSFMGGFLLDGGVHQIAALRLVAGEIASVSAVVTQHRPDLPPADTLSAALAFENGAVGTYAVTYASGSPWPASLRVVGDTGALRVHHSGIELTGADGQTRQIEFDGRSGIQNQMTAFAAAIRRGEPHFNTPAEAVQDVAIIEAMLRSAETGQRVAPERVV